MFCSNCGAKALGNFCAQCGAKLTTESTPEPTAIVDWTEEVCYEQLIRVPEVRERIALAAANARKGITGEQYLELFDKAVVPGVSLKKLTEIIVPLYASWGIKTGKSRAEHMAIKPGKALVAALCSLARHGRAIKQVKQAVDGCLVEAQLPSDLFSLDGQLAISVKRETEGTRVEAATNIPGQLYDWGKSQRCLNKLFEELAAAA